MISMCAEQEEKFQFEHFSREDALKIGLKLHENAKEQPVAVEITVNGLVVSVTLQKAQSRTASCGSRASAMRLT